MTLDKIFQKREEAAASLAQVSYSLEEGGWGAVADQEYRHRPVIAPGGYRWCPREGQQLLLLHTGDGDLCAGAAAELDALKAFWHGKLSRFQVKTPCPEFDTMVNTWNAYNSFITFTVSR